MQIPIRYRGPSQLVGAVQAVESGEDCVTATPIGDPSKAPRCGAQGKPADVVLQTRRTSFHPSIVPQRSHSARREHWDATAVSEVPSHCSQLPTLHRVHCSKQDFGGARGRGLIQRPDGSRLKCQVQEGGRADPSEDAAFIKALGLESRYSVVRRHVGYVEREQPIR